jgi:hypothetical protein
MQPENPEKGLYNKVYCEAGKDLYKQEEVTSTEEYQKATDEEKEKMLEDLFIRKKSMANLYISGKKALKDVSIPVGIFILGIIFHDSFKKIPKVLIYGGTTMIAYTLSEKFMDGSTQLAKLLETFYFQMMKKQIWNLKSLK